MLCGSRAAKQRPCSRRFTAQAAVPAAATRCWAAWRSCSSCAFAMRSMAQPRRSRAERILAVISLKDGHFLARIRILGLDAPQLPEQASRGGALSKTVTRIASAMVRQAFTARRAAAMSRPNADSL